MSKKRRRRKHRPLMPPPSTRSVNAQLRALARYNTEMARRRWRAINAKTAAARAALDAVIASAPPDPEIDALPVITGLRPAKAKPVKQKRVVAPLGIPAIADQGFMRRMGKTPKPAKRRPTPTASVPAPAAAPSPA